MRSCGYQRYKARHHFHPSFGDTSIRSMSEGSQLENGFL